MCCATSSSSSWDSPQQPRASIGTQGTMFWVLFVLGHDWRTSHRTHHQNHGQVVITCSYQGGCLLDLEKPTAFVAKFIAGFWIAGFLLWVYLFIIITGIQLIFLL